MQKQQKYIDYINAIIQKINMINNDLKFVILLEKYNKQLLKNINKKIYNICTFI